MMLSRVRCSTSTQISRTGRSHRGTNEAATPVPISQNGMAVHISVVTAITTGASTSRRNSAGIISGFPRIVGPASDLVGCSQILLGEVGAAGCVRGCDVALDLRKVAVGQRVVVLRRAARREHVGLDPVG